MADVNTKAEETGAPTEPAAGGAEEPKQAEPAAEKAPAKKATPKKVAPKSASRNAEEPGAEEPPAEGEPAGPEPTPEPAAGKALAAEARAPAPPEPERKKRLPRSERRQRAKPKRTKPKTRTPIVRPAKPERPRGRRQERRGVVVSSAMDKTIVVEVDTIKAHPRYKKVVRRSTKFHAHDEANQANVGDVVRIVETRPLSRTKHWRLVEILEVAR